MALAFLGDSLLDTGNLDDLLDFFGIDPFPAPLYSEGKASNGLVLGEAIADQLGIAPASIDLGFRLIPSFDVDPLEQNVNYAVAGSETNSFGSESNDLQLVPVGLQTQVKLFAFDLITSGAFFTASDDKPDVLVSAGSNDVFDVLADVEAFAAVIFSPGKNDDNQLKQEIVSDIVGNIEQAIASIDGLVDDIVVIGIPAIGDTPFARQIDGEIDALLSGDFAGDTREFLTDTAAAVNAKLSKIYDGVSQKAKPIAGGLGQFLSRQSTRLLSSLDELISDFSDDLLGDNGTPLTDPLVGRFGKAFENRFARVTGNADPVENVMVIDAISVFETGLENWQNSLPTSLTPITELSYRDYLEQLGSGNPNGLPNNLVVDQFAFIDGVHGTEAFNIELAELAVVQIQQEFSNFGLG